jgi:hypothetical protein
MAEASAAQDAPRARSGATVTVGLKHPNGIVLRVFLMEEVNEPVMGGGWRTVKQARAKEGIEIVLNGNAVPFGAQPKCEIVAGYALTRGVSKDVWDEWLKQNANSALVKNGLIMAWEKPDFARDAAKERRATRSGLEPLSQADDPRAPKGVKKDEAPDEDAAA